MFGLKKITAIALAVAGAVIIAVTSALVYINRNNAAKNNESVKIERINQQEGNSDSWEQPLRNDHGSEGESISSDESQDTFDPNIPDTYYLGTVTIKENDVFEANAQVSSFGQSESTFSSEEVLFYENRSQKLYILSRKLTFQGHGSITVKHGGGVFTGSQNLDSLGDLIESYGHLVKNTELSLDHSSLPVRADVKESIIFTLVPTLEQNWVTTVIGESVSLGPPQVFLPDSLTDLQIELIPGIPSIIISRNYHASESLIDEATGRFVKPQGTFSCKFTKVSEAEALFKILDLKREKDEMEKDSLYNPQKSGEENENEKVSNGDELPLPEGYPQDVVPISSDAFVAISETIPK